MCSSLPNKGAGFHIGSRTLLIHATTAKEFLLATVTPVSLQLLRLRTIQWWSPVIKFCPDFPYLVIIYKRFMKSKF